MSNWQTSLSIPFQDYIFPPCYHFSHQIRPQEAQKTRLSFHPKLFACDIPALQFSPYRCSPLYRLGSTLLLTDAFFFPGPFSLILRRGLGPLILEFWGVLVPKVIFCCLLAFYQSFVNSVFLASRSISVTCAGLVLPYRWRLCFVWVHGWSYIFYIRTFSL